MSLALGLFGSPEALGEPGPSTEARDGAAVDGAAVDGAVIKRLVTDSRSSKNLLRDDGWQRWQQGFVRQDDLFLCDNGRDDHVQRGAHQIVVLDQHEPAAIIATAESRAIGVTGSADNNYSIYLDLIYQDGDHLWGQVAPFSPGTHDWQKRQVVVLPDKPVRSVSMHLLLRSHGGAASFRRPELRTVSAPAGSVSFDGVPVVPSAEASMGFLVRDVAAESSFVAIGKRALEVELNVTSQTTGDITWYDVKLSDTSGRDRAVTLVYTLPTDPAGLSWWSDPRRSVPVVERREYVDATRFRDVGSNGRLSRYPFAAVSSAGRTNVLGIDVRFPAVFRVGYHSTPGELFLAYDIGFVPERPTAHVRFCRFTSDGNRGFRGALERYYTACPESFLRRITRQGLWMPFAKISEVRNWSDFGFRFKEGNDETGWDDKNDILTFRYTEPMTWWMRMPEEMPRTLESARSLARQLAEQGKTPQAEALLASGYHDPDGQLMARLLDTPWCNGAVWSMNSMPHIKGKATDFSLKWNPRVRDRFYGKSATSTLDGEYIDSSEGYVTGELDYRREHFARSETPLCFSLATRKPGIFRGLIAFEYTRSIARDIHGMGKLMMANSTPSRLCWLAPWLDVMGTETNWNPSGNWQPMSDSELLFRRALCGSKPFCFLMNTEFERFTSEKVESYMKRSTAYGMFPGFFSHNASQGQYFKRPELYERDRHLFQKYVPICRMLAESGWRPVTRAESSDDNVYIERFGDRYLTLFNDSHELRRVTVRLSDRAVKQVSLLLRGTKVDVVDNSFSISLPSEDLAVVDVSK